MKNKEKKVVGNAVYQFGVNNSNTQEEWDWDKILDELEALSRLRDLSTEIGQMADKEEWGLEKILDQVEVLEKEMDDKEQKEEACNENDPVWTISLFGVTPIKNKELIQLSFGLSQEQKYDFQTNELIVWKKYRQTKISKRTNAGQRERSALNAETSETPMVRA